MKGQTLPGFCASGTRRASCTLHTASKKEINVFISPARYVHLGTNVAKKRIAKRTKMISFPLKSLQNTERKSCNAFYSSGRS